MDVRGSVVRASVTLAVVMPLSLPSCGATEQPAVRTEFSAVSGYRFSWLERRAVTRVAEQAVADARRVLPGLHAHLVLRVRAGGNVTQETGEVSNAFSPNVIWWDVDPRHEGGVRAIVQRELRASLFHAFHHLVRNSSGVGRGFTETLVGEGMAIAFERDFASASRPWGQCTASDRARIDQVLAMSAGEWGTWLAADRRARRWAGQRVGTCIVDAAITASRRDVAQMVALPTEDVIRLATTPGRR